MARNASAFVFFGREKVPAMDESTPPVDADNAEPALPLAPESTGSGDERRYHHRRTKQVRVLIAETEDLKDPFTGWVLDRSVGGLRLSVSREFPSGAILHVHPPEAPESTWVQVEVKSCAGQEETWELGCQFVRSPSYYVLLMFG